MSNKSSDSKKGFCIISTGETDLQCQIFHLFDNSLKPAYTIQYCVQDVLQHLAWNTLQGILHIAILHSG